ncbi:hypothetical protein [Leptonema illini]|uniref:Uncharacterized protein n=1 Tax=Leptonema illini DSM 21528 TaxID=929563 RepID=H2CBX6_9LEPT|nr:hypothetical protein [Leptonema illini]EHQ08648.1 hypothetical protein Lepil_4000 [Leptonema illini DSM 21528]
MIIVYTKEHILKVFACSHEIARVVDPAVDPGLEPREDLLLRDWIEGMDLILDARVQLDHFRKAYSASIPETEFGNLWRSKDSTLGALADLIAEHSQPVHIPEWKFVGRECERGTILRFLLHSINSRSPQRIATGRTSLGFLAKGRDWSFVDAINIPFPGVLPPPVRVSHRRLQPVQVRVIQSAFSIVSVASGVAVVAAFLLKAPAAAIIGAFFLALSITSMILFRKQLGLASTVHYIFPGVRSLRELSLLICERRKGGSA